MRHRDLRPRKPLVAVGDQAGLQQPRQRGFLDVGNARDPQQSVAVDPNVDPENFGNR